MKKKAAIRYFAFAVTGFMICVGAYAAMWRQTAAATETAFSLCAAEILQGGEESLKNARNYLTFSALSEEGKQYILSAMVTGDPNLSSVAERMAYFSFSERNLRALESEVREKLADAVAAVSLTDDKGRHAEALVKALFGRNLRFNEANNEYGFAKRLYCANISVSETDDGTVLFLCGLESDVIEEKLYSFLFGKSRPLPDQIKFRGRYMEKRFRTAKVDAWICVESVSGQIMAAKIQFND